MPRAPPGLESGACLPRGNSGTWESPLAPCVYSRTGGPGDHRPWRELGSFPPGHAPVRETTTDGSPPGTRDARDKRSNPRGTRWQSSRRIGPRQVGTRGPRDPRAGRRRRAACPTGGHPGRDSERTHPDTSTPGDCGGEPRRCVRNRMREWRTSGSVGGPDGYPSALPGSRLPTALYLYWVMWENPHHV